MFLRERTLVGGMGTSTGRKLGKSRTRGRKIVAPEDKMHDALRQLQTSDVEGRRGCLRDTPRVDCRVVGDLRIIRDKSK